jgi:hypothetical protein
MIAMAVVNRMKAGMIVTKTLLEPPRGEFGPLRT